GEESLDRVSRNEWSRRDVGWWASGTPFSRSRTTRGRRSIAQYNPGVSERYVGAALSPREARKHVLGRGSYIADLTAPGMLHAAFVRSPHAHARVVRVDVDAARRSPGVVAVLTGHDLAHVTTPLRIAPPIEGLVPMETATLPADKVRFVGDPVACVIADDRYAVDDACSRVDA